MKRLMISAIAAIAVLATTITPLWSHTPSTELSAGTASMPSLQELYAAANATADDLWGALGEASALKGASMRDMAKIMEAEIQRLGGGKPGARVSQLKEQIAESRGWSQD